MKSKGLLDIYEKYTTAFINNGHWIYNLRPTIRAK